MPSADRSAATFCPECAAPGGRIHALSCSRYPAVESAAQGQELEGPEGIYNPSTQRDPNCRLCQEDKFHTVHTSSAARVAGEAFCKGGTETCEVCVGSCGIEELLDLGESDA